jgi:putative ABC transport system permease protein
MSVLVIALIIAIGTGVYAGLGSTGRWRRMANDASFAATRFHDLEVTVSPGTYVPQGALAALLAKLPEGHVVAAQERLQVPTQVDASTPDRVILVPGRLVGADLAPDAVVDALDLHDGTMPDAGASPPEVVIEQKFAKHYSLSAAGTMLLSGGHTVSYTGAGMTPEYFLITGDGEAGFLAEANYAVVFGGLADVQRIAGLHGQVNDLVLRVGAGVGADTVQGELEPLIGSLSGVSATITTRDDEAAYRLLYDDIDGDQQMWNALSALVFLAASVAGFNLIGRIVDAQRRELGVQMALGVEPARIAIRPMLIAAQIALLGTILGVIVGLLIGVAMRSLLTELLPLPVWRTPFQFGTFAFAATIGFVVPFAASTLPILRVMRMEPVDAIRTAHRPGKSIRLIRASRHLRLPGGSVAQLPLRNLLHSPRRTALTAVGAGAAIAAFVGVLGMLDTFRLTIDHGNHELTRGSPDRVIVQLQGLASASGTTVQMVTSSPLVARSSMSLEFPVTIRVPAASTDSAEIDALISIIDFDNEVWTPTVDSVLRTGSTTELPGIVLARKAASDLGVETGDLVQVRHPAIGPDGGLTMSDSLVEVIGTHPSPLRSTAYLGTTDAARFGVPPVVNRLDILPAVGVTADQLRRAMFAVAGVASAQSVEVLTSVFDEALAQFVSFLVLTALAVTVMALLIAFNSTSISVDERTREHATLFAFGLPVRSVVWVTVKESAMVGLLATIVGLGLGGLLVQWMMGTIVARTVPEFGFDITIGPITIAAAFAIGVVAVGLTPLLSIRRLRRMDIADALRVME